MTIIDRNILNQLNLWKSTVGEAAAAPTGIILGAQIDPLTAWDDLIKKQQENLDAMAKTIADVWKHVEAIPSEAPKYTHVGDDLGDIIGKIPWWGWVAGAGLLFLLLKGKSGGVTIVK